jgi:tetratricopeptide (TPR) repeat protein
MKNKEYQKALDDFRMAINLAPKENKEYLSDIYNNKADSNRKIGKIDLAIKDINKALELNSKNGIAYATLSEICALQNDDVGFYKNSELALGNNFPLWEFAEIDPIYDTYKDTQKFKELIDKYKIKDK